MSRGSRRRRSCANSALPYDPFPPAPTFQIGAAEGRLCRQQHSYAATAQIAQTRRPVIAGRRSQGVCAAYRSSADCYFALLKARVGMILPADYRNVQGSRLLFI